MIEAINFLGSVPDEHIKVVDISKIDLSPYLKQKTVAFTGTHVPDSLLPKGIISWQGVEAEPAVATVEKMTNVLRQYQPDTVVAIGGGSVLDAAKAAYLSYQTELPLTALFGVNRWSSIHQNQKLKRIIAIPTTSGTGSEATPYANIVDLQLGVKKLISEQEIVPEIAFISGQLTGSMPVNLSRATGCDALAHLLEGVLNTGADNLHPQANQWGRCGIRLICSALPKVITDPMDFESRQKMAVAATLGGMVIRYKSTGLPHLCSFSWFGRIAHGEAVALLLPAAWSYYLSNPAVAERTMELQEFFPGSTPREVIGSYRKFLTRLGMPAALNYFSGITADLLKQTAASGKENQMKLKLAPKPVPLEKSEKILADILNKAYIGEY